MSGLVSQNDLCAWLGYEQPERVRKWLMRHRIPFSEGRDGQIVTTQAAVDAAFVRQVNQEARNVEFI